MCAVRIQARQEVKKCVTERSLSRAHAPKEREREWLFKGRCKEERERAGVWERVSECVCVLGSIGRRTEGETVSMCV